MRIRCRRHELGAAVVCAALVTLLTFLAVLPAAGQITGSIDGHVVAYDGGSLPGVTVTAVGRSGRTFTAVTDADGAFRLLHLPQDHYDVLAQLDSFKPAYEEVFVGIGSTVSLNLVLGPGTIEETVIVTAEAPSVESLGRDSPSEPAWNFWLEVKDGVDAEPLSHLQPGRLYHVYLDLSRLRYEDLGIYGASSRSTAAAFAAELVETFYTLRRLELTARVRPVLVGRALELPRDGPEAESWQAGRWMPEAASRIPFPVRLGNLFAEELPARGQDEGFRAFSERTRAGALRFAVKAVEEGCALVTFSIWGEEGSLPLDHLAFPVAVGNADCGPAAAGRELAPGLLSLMAGTPGARPDAAFHLFEAERGRRAETVAVLSLPGDPDSPCDTYAWEIPGSVSRFFFEQEGFREGLQSAWEDDTQNGYILLSRQLERLLFTRRKGPRDGPRGGEGSAEGPAKCGAAEALEALRTSTGSTLFARLVDLDNASLFLPLGLLFPPEEPAAAEGTEPEGTSPATPTATVRLLQPLPREGYGEEAGCIGAWSFLLPESLGERLEVELPEALAGDVGVRRTMEGLRDVLGEWRAADDIPAAGVVLLAHHLDGSLRHEDPKDPWLWTETGAFPRGSAALLATCSAGDLSRSRELVDALNEAGFDALMLSPFEVHAHFGIALALNFSELVAEARKAPKPPRIIDLFHEALDLTAKELEPIFEDRAHGMAREFVYAGNPSLRLCAGSP